MIARSKYFTRKLTTAVGKVVFADLTYGLFPSVSESRSVLLTSERPKVEEKELRAVWENLKNLTESQEGGRFNQDKSLVRAIRESPEKFPDLGIAIHAFGPVPVMLTGFKKKQSIYGSDIMCEVAIYYSRRHAQDTEKFFFPNQEAFLDSLYGQFPQLMCRYFEDVGEIFRDITQRANLRRSYEYAKLAEDLIGQSINTKLKASVPERTKFHGYLMGDFSKLVTEEQEARLRGSRKYGEVESHELDRLVSRWREEKTNEEKAKCILFEEHAADVYLASYARCLALFMINELYKHLGLTAVDYIERLRELDVTFSDLLGYRACSEFVSENPDLSVLQELKSCYLERRFDELYELESESKWVSNFIKFAKFLIGLDQNQIAAEDCRMFVSFPHQVENAELLKNELISNCSDLSNRRVHVLTVEDLPVGNRHKDTIKARIWQSDFFIGILPKSLIRPNGHGEASYRWIASEAEHALLLGKKVLFFIENGVSREVFQRIIETEDFELLEPNIRIKVRRNAKLLAAFNDRIHLNFEVDSLTGGNLFSLGSLAHDTFSKVSDNLFRERYESRLRGFLNQFSVERRIVFMCLIDIIDSHFGEPLSSDEIGTVLYNKYGRDSELSKLFGTKDKARTSFMTTWTQANARSLRYRERDVYLISKDSSKGTPQYLLRLTELICLLSNHPQISKLKLQEALKDCFPDEKKHLVNTCLK